MSLKLNLADNSILFEAPLLESDSTKARLLHIFVFLLLSIREPSGRLESALLQLSTEDLSGSLMHKVAFDIWTILDAFRRLEPILKGLGLHHENAHVVQLQRDIKDARDSFQHIEERLNDYYAQGTVETSILGDFRWHYRPTLTDKIRAFICVTGAARGGITISPSLGSLPANSTRTGVFDLQFSYVKRTIIRAKKQEYSYTTMMIPIDALIYMLNFLIQSMESTFQQGVDKVKQTQQVDKVAHYGLPGFVISCELP